MPVIFNLATWAVNRPLLGDWMAEELVYSYQVPQRVARSWMATDAVLPLLDGFDEVAEAHRAACAEAINVFAQAHPQLPLVVCSRSAEYRAQPVHLALRAAVVVQPLTDDQIRDYLVSGGERLSPLREAVEADADLRDLLRTPLLLRLVTLTYGDLPRTAIPPVGDREAWRQRLFGEYVARMLERERTLEQPAIYSPEQTADFLGWLGRQMRAHGLVEFYLERLQPDWLPDARARQGYAWFAAWLVFGLVFGLGTGLFFGLLFGLAYGPVGGLVGGLVVGLFAGLAIMGGVLSEEEKYGAVTINPISLVPAFQIQWRGLVLGLVFGLGTGLFFGLLSGLVGALDSALGARVVYGLGSPVRTGLFFGLLTGLVFGLGSALNLREVDEYDYREPAEGIRRSVQNAIIFVLVFGLGIGLVWGLVGGLLGGLAGGLGFGLFGGLFRGGLGAVIEYGALRWQLRRTGVVPPHPVRFLDHAANHVLLQKIGGGYRFVHVLLRDYFADQYLLRQE